MAFIAILQGTEMGIFREIFTWWNGNTIGTRLTLWRKGKFVGKDEFGNSYFLERNGQRRWVTYNGISDPTTVPPDWHGWLHYTVDTPPVDENYKPKQWQKPHKPNMTGTSGAYRPSGSTLSTGERPKATGDYDAWKPE